MTLAWPPGEPGISLPRSADSPPKRYLQEHGPGGTDARISGLTDYQGALGATVSLLVDAFQGRNWQKVVPSVLRIFQWLGAFDYAAETHG